MTRGPVRIHGVLRDYEWGAVDGLTRWSRTRTGQPQAELWYGSHAAAPSPVFGEPWSTLLDSWPEHPAPLLVKLLAAASPLSIQVHPTAATIRQWWQEPASSALLSDTGEKTEMLIALEPFTILVGWRPAAESEAVLRCLGAEPPVLAALRAGDHTAAVRALLGEHPVVAMTQAWIDAFGKSGLDENARSAIAAVARRFGEDPGVAVAALLDSDVLDVGDAVYVPAGVPHAYVQGLGLEVMNASDNVLRMGLTTKTMSVEHTLAALVAERHPQIIRRPADGHYSVPGAPFDVRLVHGDHTASVGTYRLVLALEGRTAITIGEITTPLDPGEAFAIPEESASASIVAFESAVVVSATREAR